ncbi:hypothetical protein [Nannocystis exedens]|uniref:hypothetical protein n=1 Tax=Nannocystis exedens TaxID=54 RepID=UPI001160A21B|nr:hypothetical protein [Nannocystis exedens]
MLENLEREPCAGSMSHLEAHVERIFEFLGVAVPGDFRVPVYVEDDVPCGFYACYLPATRSVHVPDLDRGSRRPTGVIRHELAHAVIDRAWGRSVPFLTEGLAEAMARSTAWPVLPEPTLAIGDMLDATGLALDYQAAARFVRFLIDTRGLAAFEQFFRSTQERSQTAIRASIEAVYGEDFDSLESEFLAGPACQYQLDLCDERGADRLDEAWLEVFAASCLDPDFYGSDGADRPLFATRRTLRLDEGGSYRLRLEGELVVSPGGIPRLPQVALVRCGGCDQQFTRVFQPGEHELQLDAGLYALELLPADTSVLTVAIDRVDEGESPP